MESLPIIDLSRWTSSTSGEIDRRAVAQELVQACHETGFVYITNHGISKGVLDQAFEFSKAFFELSKEEKMKAGNVAGSKAFRGYSWPGNEKTSSLPKHPATGKARDESSDLAINLTESYSFGSDLDPHDENVWLPDSVLPGFREVITQLYNECWATAQEILKVLAVGLGLEDEEYLLRFHSGHENEVSLRYYPPVPESVILREKMKRLGSHTDFGSFTLLFQDDCGGLEVQKAGALGEFIAAPPIEGALLMNIGDILMRWSNDYLVSTIHRVHLPPLRDRYSGKERMTRARYSIPYFVDPKRDTNVECLPISHGPAKYKPVTYRQYFEERINEIFET